MYSLIRIKFSDRRIRYALLPLLLLIHACAGGVEVALKNTGVNSAAALVSTAMCGKWGSRPVYRNLGPDMTELSASDILTMWQVARLDENGKPVSIDSVPFDPQTLSDIMFLASCDSNAEYLSAPEKVGCHIYAMALPPIGSDPEKIPEVIEITATDDTKDVKDLAVDIESISTAKCADSDDDFCLYVGDLGGTRSLGPLKDVQKSVIMYRLPRSWGELYSAKTFEFVSQKLVKKEELEHGNVLMDVFRGVFRGKAKVFSERTNVSLSGIQAALGNPELENSFVFLRPDIVSNETLSSLGLVDTDSSDTSGQGNIVRRQSGAAAARSLKINTGSMKDVFSADALALEGDDATSTDLDYTGIDPLGDRVFDFPSLIFLWAKENNLMDASKSPFKELLQVMPVRIQNKIKQLLNTDALDTASTILRDNYIDENGNIGANEDDFDDKSLTESYYRMLKLDQDAVGIDGLNKMRTGHGAGQILGSIMPTEFQFTESGRWFLWTMGGFYEGTFSPFAAMPSLKDLLVKNTSQFTVVPFPLQQSEAMAPVRDRNAAGYWDGYMNLYYTEELADAILEDWDKFEDWRTDELLGTERPTGPRMYMLQCMDEESSMSRAREQ